MIKVIEDHVELSGTTSVLLAELHGAIIGYMKAFKVRHEDVDDEAIKSIINKMIKNVFDDYDDFTNESEKTQSEENTDIIAEEIEKLSKSVKEILDAMEKAVETIKKN